MKSLAGVLAALLITSPVVAFDVPEAFRTRHSLTEGEKAYVKTDSSYRELIKISRLIPPNVRAAAEKKGIAELEGYVFSEFDYIRSVLVSGYGYCGLIDSYGSISSVLRESHSRGYNFNAYDIYRAELYLCPNIGKN